jgi:hypothetical protein
MKLVEKMKASLPMQARPTRELVKMLRRQGLSLDRYRDVQIRQIFYGGDEGESRVTLLRQGKKRHLFWVR